ncbi:hypothetical protein FHS42_003495 [Streptomyces zagrosensis]|uniref:Uncharacterized protein n=1 Tax=Streptomyces zagrosensis TaxID=1042984 RepID=A0A7W9UYX7_9ACTN|nr:hypothetical protein [Streptomyces zagrosensis]
MEFADERQGDEGVGAGSEVGEDQLPTTGSYSRGHPWDHGNIPPTHCVPLGVSPHHPGS